MADRQEFKFGIKALFFDFAEPIYITTLNGIGLLSAARKAFCPGGSYKLDKDELVCVLSSCEGHKVLAITAEDDATREFFREYFATGDTE